MYCLGLSKTAIFAKMGCNNAALLLPFMNYLGKWCKLSTPPVQTHGLFMIAQRSKHLGDRKVDTRRYSKGGKAYKANLKSTLLVSSTCEAMLRYLSSSMLRHDLGVRRQLDLTR